MIKFDERLKLMKIIAIFFVLLSTSSFCMDKNPLLIYYGSELTRAKAEQFDNVVLEPTHYSDVSSWNTTTYGYLSIGEIHKDRSWYFLMQKTGVLLAPNPNWPDSRYTSWKTNLWPNYILSFLIPDLIRKGYKGVFLDTMESALSQDLSQEQALDFLQKIKQKWPQFKVFLNRSFSVAKEAPIDAVLLESTLSDYNFKSKTYELIQNPQSFVFHKSIKVFSLDYWLPEDKQSIFSIYRKALDRGYLPLISTLDLQTVPEILPSDVKSADPSIFHEIKRKVLALYDSSVKETSVLNLIHENLDVPLNYYGYYTVYKDLSKPLPEPDSDTAAIVLWLNGNGVSANNQLLHWLKNAKEKHIPILWLGTLPIPPDIQSQSQANAINLLKDNFGIDSKGDWHEASADVEFTGINNEFFGFEKQINLIHLRSFQAMTIESSAQYTPLVSFRYGKNPCIGAVKAPWGLFVQDSFSRFIIPGKHYWLLNPFKAIESLLPQKYPVPDPASIEDKRTAYIHIDGDGAKNQSEVKKGKLCPEIFLEDFLSRYDFPVGVSFIAAEVHPDYQGSPKMEEIARKVLAHPLVEPASHTFSHPYSWEKNLVAFNSSPTTKLVTANYSGTVSAVKSKIVPEFEILKSLDYISSLSPESKRPVNTLYWSGDCMPTHEHLEFIKKHGILAMNGGDSFFDREYNSMTWLTPIGREVDGLFQVYSSNSNENVYTQLWTATFWNFANVVQTFENSGYPRRLKPVNLYFHFYSMEKFASSNAMHKIFQWFEKHKEKLQFVTPSEYIRIAENFYNLEIKKKQNHYQIKNATHLKTFRFPGDVKVKDSKNITSIKYSKTMDSTYITIAKDKTYADFSIVQERQ
jgi:hypothetical protein